MFIKIWKNWPKIVIFHWVIYKIFCKFFRPPGGSPPPPEPPTRRPPTSLWPCPKNPPPRPCRRMASSPKKSLPRIYVYVLVHAKWSEFCENFRIHLETSFLIIVEIYLLDTLPPLPQPHSPLRVWPCPCMPRLCDYKFLNFFSFRFLFYFIAEMTFFHVHIQWIFRWGLIFLYV